MGRAAHRPDATDTLTRALTEVTRLPTPAAADGTGGHERRGGDRGDELLLPGVARDLSRLPTPAVLDKDFNALGTAAAREESGKQMHLAHVLGRDLLPTPAVNDMGEGKTPEEFDRWNTGPTMAHQMHSSPLSIEAQRITNLPTPRASAGRHAAPGSHGGVQLADVFIPEKAKRLPTPDAYQGTRGGGVHPDTRRAGGHSVSLADVSEHEVKRLSTPKATNNENRASEGYKPGVGWQIAHTDWAQYGPAIRIWEEVIGRPAPEPTIPGKRGEPRLNPALTEWMMGLAEGHVCDVPGLSREAKLKACGNGVVPQQAAAALRLLLADLRPLVQAYASEVGEASAA